MNLIKFKADGNEKLSEAILARFNGAMSYSLVMKLIRQKDVKINGERTNKDVAVAKGDEISVYTTARDNRAENVLFEDENILVAIKQRHNFGRFLRTDKENPPDRVFRSSARQKHRRNYALRFESDCERRTAERL